MNPALPYPPAQIGRTLRKVDRLGSPLVVDPPQGVADEETRAPGRPTRLTPARQRWIVAILLVAAMVSISAYALTRGPETPPITATDVNKAVQDGIAKAEEDAAKAPPDAATA